MNEVRRFQVPVDDEWHRFNVTGPILHVATRGEGYVEFWFLHQPAVTWQRKFRVFGTGQSVAESVTYVGTAITPNDGRFVWHLFEDAVGSATHVRG